MSSTMAEFDSQQMKSESHYDPLYKQRQSRIYCTFNDAVSTSDCIGWLVKNELEYWSGHDIICGTIRTEGTVKNHESFQPVQSCPGEKTNPDHLKYNILLFVLPCLVLVKLDAAHF